jgi:hypothetical protein
MWKSRAITLVLLIALALSGATVRDAFARNLAFLPAIGYFLSPSADPQDARLDRARALFTRLAQHDAVRYQPYSLRLEGIANLLSSAHNQEYVNGWTELEHARQAQSLGDWEKAEEHYRRAAAVGTEQVRLEAYVLLADLSRARRDTAGLESNVGYAAENISPLAMRFAGCQDIELVGGYVDERDIALDQPVHIVLIWEKHRADLSLDQDDETDVGGQDGNFWQWAADESRLLQIGMAANLVPDGGFERTVLPREGFPHQLPRALYGRQTPDHTALRYGSPVPGENMVLELCGRGDTPAGVGSTPTEIPQARHSTVYLITGRYRTFGDAQPKIGIRWLLEGAARWSDNVSSYAIQQPAAEWTRFAALMTPPEKAIALQYWVLNADAVSRMQVDDLGLFLVPLPCAAQEVLQ